MEPREPVGRNGSAEEEALEAAARLVGKKWNARLLKALLEDDDGVGFTALKDRIEGISGKVLSDRLEELQEYGVVSRRVVSRSPERVEYELTARGEDLEPVIERLTAWSRTHVGESPATVLLADDDRRLVEMHATWLADDFEVRTATSGQEVMDALDDEVDVVVLDRRMPVHTGDDLVGYIDERDLCCGVVFLSSTQPGPELLEMGIDAFLPKPTDRAKLRETIRAVHARQQYDEDVRRYAALRSLLHRLDVSGATDVPRATETLPEARRELERLQERLEEVPSDALVES